MGLLGQQSHAGTRESLGGGGRWALSREMRPALLPSWQAPVVLHECVARSFHGGRSIAADVAAEPSRTDRDWDVVDEEAQAEMWRKLYARDYTEKADLAKFLAAATELVEERQAKREAEELRLQITQERSAHEKEMRDLMSEQVARQDLEKRVFAT
ncbi:MAG: hypothetical protein ACPIOQ_24020, partial [Promethearchaeia archaeon]